MPRKRQSWKVGDTFVVPLADSSLVPGYIVAYEPQALNSVTCAFFECRVDSSCLKHLAFSVSLEKLISCVLTTRDLLDNGSWSIVGHEYLQIPEDLLPHELNHNEGWVGARIFGSGNVVSFLNAFHGLAAWDDWVDPLYLDNLLIHPSKKPANLILRRIS